MFDLCVTNGNQVSLDQAIDAYAQECQSRGISICDWRQETDTGNLFTIVLSDIYGRYCYIVVVFIL